MSKEDFFSILIIPPKSGKIWKTRVPKFFLGIILFITVMFLLAGVLFSFNYFQFNSYQSNYTKLQEENQNLEKRIGGLQNTITRLEGEMFSLVEKDKKIRTIFGLPEIDNAVREVGVGGFNADLPFFTKAGESSNLTEKGIDKLVRQAQLEKKSFDLIYSQLQEKKTILEHTPSIAPVQGYFSRGFGTGIDPFTGLNQMHQGIDLAADKGTPIYAPADGKISSITVNSNLGNLVEINHLYGYKTFYGHLALVKVHTGQTVKRGDLIGTVGNTGYSTGPHLHYEIHFHNQPLNPQKLILNNSFLVD